MSVYDFSAVCCDLPLCPLSSRSFPLHFDETSLFAGDEKEAGKLKVWNSIYLFFIKMRFFSNSVWQSNCAASCCLFVFGHKPVLSRFIYTANFKQQELSQSANTLWLCVCVCVRVCVCLFPPGRHQTGLPQHLQDHGLCRLLQMPTVGETAGETLL